MLRHINGEYSYTHKGGFERFHVQPSSATSVMPRVFLFISALVLVMIALLLNPVSVHAATLTVTSNADSGPGTLREALDIANTNGEPDLITFASDMTIQPLTSYAFTEDGTTISGAGHLVDIDGSLLAMDSPCFMVSSNQDELRSLCIINVPAGSIETPAIELHGDGNTVAGCYIGLDRAGVAAPNLIGVRMVGTTNATIGGAASEDRNVISGNALAGIKLDAASTNNTVLGNYIGTGSDGLSQVPNLAGIWFSSATGNTIGGIGVDDLNVISGNTSSNLWLDAASTGNTICGNLIGPDASGTSTFPDQEYGLIVHGPDNTIGGATPGHRNVIAGNKTNVGLITGSNRSTVQGNYIGVDSTGNTSLPSPSETTYDVMTFSPECRIISNHIGGPGTGGIGVMDDAADAVIQGNSIGLGADGHSDTGIAVGIWSHADRTVIGGSESGQGNVIVNARYGIGYQVGIIINPGGEGHLAVGAAVRGNRIGISPDGDPMPCTFAVLAGGADAILGGDTAECGNIVAYNGAGIQAGANSIVIRSNTIHSNDGAGVLVGGGTRVNIRSNSIYANGDLGIDIVPDIGPNVPQDNYPYPTEYDPNFNMHFPEISQVIYGGGELSVHGTAIPSSTVDVYSSDAGEGTYGQGRNHLGTATTSDQGDFSLSVQIPTSPDFVTSTATDTQGNTSEFGLNTRVSFSPPRITSINPKSGIVGQTIWINIHGNDTHFIDGTSRAVISESDGVIVRQTKWMSATWVQAQVCIRDHATPGLWDINVLTPGEAQSPLPLVNGFEVKMNPPPSEPEMPKKYYLAEGSCRPGFDPYISIMNPSDSGAVVNILYLLGNGKRKSQDLEIGAHVRATVHPPDVLGTADDKAHDFSFIVECKKGDGLAVSRTIYFNYRGKVGSSGSGAATEPLESWYFAEGTCRPGFDTYLCIANPGGASATMRITYMLGNGSVREQTVTIGANARETIYPRDVIGTGDDAGHDFSTKVECTNGQRTVVERPIYFTFNGSISGGHVSLGAGAPAQTWYLPEGTSVGGFETYICVQNPGSSDADVTLTYLKEGGGATSSQSVSVSPSSRVTLRPADAIGADCSFASEVECTSGQRIIAERSSYFTYQGMDEGSNSMGATSLHNHWYLPEGCQSSANQFDTYYLIQNPNQAEITCDFRFMTGTGDVFEKTYRVAPLTRKTISLASEAEFLRNLQYYDGIATEVTSSLPVAVEQAMYSRYRGGKGGETSVGLGLGKQESIDILLRKKLGITLTGNGYWSNGPASRTSCYFPGLSVSYFKDNPATTQDEGLKYKQAWFRNPLIYVPYDLFLPENLKQGVAIYKKVFKQLKSYYPDSIGVVFIFRCIKPPREWPGWGQVPHGSSTPLIYPDGAALQATGIDAENGQWATAVANFCKCFGSNVKYYEILDEPGFDKPSECEDTHLNGSCVQDYPVILRIAYEKIHGFASEWNDSHPTLKPLEPVVVSGSLLLRPDIRILNDFWEENELQPSSYKYYRELKQDLVKYSDAIGVHFFGAPTESTWPNNPYLFSYNHLRNDQDLFVDVKKPILVTSFGLPWAINDPLHKDYLPDNEHSDPLQSFHCIEHGSGKLEYGLDSLLYETTCSAAWYWNDVAVGFKDGIWSGSSFYGLGMTYSDSVKVNTNPLTSKPEDWTVTDTMKDQSGNPVTYQPPSMWGHYIRWINATE
ncbi:MAG: hypothetical protein KKF41_07290 [Actinobacteria bacterium]|nr:hypothetical protein [Actinomycetota bacterium]MBU1942278.1 hypothetical protein [Actinomycetota bacterium]MBU2687373.1 hypothetical protein [Actinomycetota bacterium]